MKDECGLCNQDQEGKEFLSSIRMPSGTRRLALQLCEMFMPMHAAKPAVPRFLQGRKAQLTNIQVRPRVFFVRLCACLMSVPLERVARVRILSEMTCCSTHVNMVQVS